MLFLYNYFIYFYIEKRKTSASGERRKTDERKLLEAIADICANTANTTHTSSDEDFSRVKSAMQDIRGKLSQFAQDVANTAKNCIFSLETILKYISEKKDSSAKLSHNIYLIKQARQTETDIQRKLTIALNEKTELLKMRDYMKKDIAEMERTICHLKRNLRQAKKNTDKKIDFTFSNRYKRERPSAHLCSHRGGASSVTASIPSAPDHTDSDTADEYTDNSDAEYFHSDDHKYIEKPETEILERDDDTMLSPTALRGGADVAEARPVTVTLPRPSAGRPIKSSRSINPKRLYVDENAIPDPEPLAYTSMIPLGDHKNVTHSIQIKVDLVTPSLISQRKLPNINTDHTQTDMHCRSEGDGAETKPVVQVAREKMKKRLFRKK